MALCLVIKSSIGPPGVQQLKRFLHIGSHFRSCAEIFSERIIMVD